MKVVNYAIFGAVIAIAVGLLGVYGLDLSQEKQSSTVLATGQMLGHITLTHHDKDGNLVSYRQTDNIIVNVGEQCALKQIFGRSGVGTVTPTGTNACGSALTANPGVFDVIAIGNKTGTGFVSGTNTALGSEINQTGAANNQNLERDSSAARTKVYSTTTGPPTSANVVLSAEFTNNSANTYTITESGIFNSTSAPNPTANPNTVMFAHQGFTGIPLATGEKLTVQWTVNIGGQGDLDTSPAEPTGP